MEVGPAAGTNGNVVKIFNVLDEDNLGPGVQNKPHWMHTQAHMKIGSYLKPARPPFSTALVSVLVT